MEIVQMICLHEKNKVFERMFKGSPPSPVAASPGIRNSRPLWGTAQGVARAESMFMHVGYGAPSCQHQIECPSCHRCWFCKLEGSQAVRPQEDMLPEMKQNSEILRLFLAGGLQLLTPTEILACNGFSEYHCRSCRQVASKACWLHLTPVGCTMLLVQLA